MTIKPLNDKVLIKPKETGEEKTKGGIYIPESAKEDKVMEGEVIAIGNSKDISVKPGDKVIFEGFGTEIRVGNEKLLIIGVKDILAKVE